MKNLDHFKNDFGAASPALYRIVGLRVPLDAKTGLQSLATQGREPDVFSELPPQQVTEFAEKMTPGSGASLFSGRETPRVGTDIGKEGVHLLICPPPVHAEDGRSENSIQRVPSASANRRNLFLIKTANESDFNRGWNAE